jgi:phage/plasmid-like protein (TIGR03299 family)
MTITASTTTSTLAGFMDGRNWIGHADERRVYDGAVPTQDAIDLLSYPLVEANLTATWIDENGVSSVDLPDRKAIVRADTGVEFGIFKGGYQIHHPAEWLVERLDLLTHGGLQIATVAVTNGGARVIVQAQLPETITATAPGAEPVQHRPWASAATSMDGTIATTYGVGETLLICENQLHLPGFRQFIANFNAVHKVKHSRNSLLRLNEARLSLGLVVEQVADEFDREFKELVSAYVSDAKFNEIVKAFTGVDTAKDGRSKTMAENKVRALNDLWRNDERAASWRNSQYGVLAAFNTAQQWEFGSDKGRTERNQNNLITGKREQFDANILRMLQTA